MKNNNEIIYDNVNNIIENFYYDVSSGDNRESTDTTQKNNDKDLYIIVTTQNILDEARLLYNDFELNYKNIQNQQKIIDIINQFQSTLDEIVPTNQLNFEKKINLTLSELFQKNQNIVNYRNIAERLKENQMLLDPNGVPSVELQKAITDFYNSVNIDVDFYSIVQELDTFINMVNANITLSITNKYNKIIQELNFQIKELKIKDKEQQKNITLLNNLFNNNNQIFDKIANSIITEILNKEYQNSIFNLISFENKTISSIMTTQVKANEIISENSNDLSSIISIIITFLLIIFLIIIFYLKFF